VVEFDAGQIRDTAAAGRAGDRLLDELAAKTARGDKDAFEQIYVRTNDELYRFVRGLCGNATVAEDLVAGTYLRAWRSAATYRIGSATYQRWLFRIARNLVADHWRVTPQTVSIDDLDFEAPLEGSDSLEADEARLEIARLLARLTPQQREVVVLRYLNHKSFREIAQLLGKREGAVRVQLARALRSMRKVLEDAS
jgi:RNA polymerase sigma-70 factor (ECF subfamily)